LLDARLERRAARLTVEGLVQIEVAVKAIAVDEEAREAARGLVAIARDLVHLEELFDVGDHVRVRRPDRTEDVGHTLSEKRRRNCIELNVDDLVLVRDYGGVDDSVLMKRTTSRTATTRAPVLVLRR